MNAGLLSLPESLVGRGQCRMNLGVVAHPVQRKRQVVDRLLITTESARDLPTRLAVHRLIGLNRQRTIDEFQDFGIVVISLTEQTKRQVIKRERIFGIQFDGLSQVANGGGKIVFKSDQRADDRVELGRRLAAVQPLPNQLHGVPTEIAMVDGHLTQPDQRRSDRPA